MLDMFPFMFHLPLPDYKALKEFVKFQDMCWQQITEMQSDIKEGSLTKLLLENATHKTAGINAELTEAEAGMTCLTLIFAGVITTSVTMHLLLNTLAFRPEIQERIHSEISEVLAVGTHDHITLSDRRAMPYLRATIFECLRYFSTTTEGGI